MRSRNGQLLAFCVLTSLWVTGQTGSECPLKLEPSTVVVRYGDPVSVNCTVSGAHNGIGWEAAEGSVERTTHVEFLTWKLDSLTYWEIGPSCYGNFPNGTGPPSQCNEKLKIIVYKPPDSVSLRAVNHEGPMLEGRQYQLQCEVQNIAPVQYLTVRLYKVGNKTFYNNLAKPPVNVSRNFQFTPTSADDGEQYSCEAELNLGPEGPHPPPSIKSEPLSITVHYAPYFYRPEDEILEEAEGEVVHLNCSAQGNPPPTYSWSPLPNKEENSNEMPAVSISLAPGTYEYTCNASNAQGYKIKKFTVKIIAIVDYLPLIAGIVALSVVFILIAFSFIYCIYYKNTKMGQYDLKVGKSRSPGAHVAQNGRDSSLPMKKLTQPRLHV